MHSSTFTCCTQNPLISLAYGHIWPPMARGLWSICRISQGMRTKWRSQGSSTSGADILQTGEISPVKQNSPLQSPSDSVDGCLVIDNSSQFHGRSGFTLWRWQRMIPQWCCCLAAWTVPQCSLSPKTKDMRSMRWWWIMVSDTDMNSKLQSGWPRPQEFRGGSCPWTFGVLVDRH